MDDAVLQIKYTTVTYASAVLQATTKVFIDPALLIHRPRRLPLDDDPNGRY